ncbi:MAG TPA: hypothetical protein PKE45_16605 [Caldilineaceae bacterium]|nr:hypothetical protein [Caldilineaceae bacterium]
MSQRTEVLATRLEQGAIQLADFAERLTPRQWAAIIAHEERSVGVLVHHVATMYLLETDLAQAITGGQAVAGVTWALVAEINAKHALEHAEPECTATLTLLRQNSAVAAAAIRTMSDTQLDTAVPISLYGDAPLTLQFWLEDHQVTHSYRHLAAITAAIG